MFNIQNTHIKSEFVLSHNTVAVVKRIAVESREAAEQLLSYLADNRFKGHLSKWRNQELNCGNQRQVIIQLAEHEEGCNHKWMALSVPSLPLKLASSVIWDDFRINISEHGGRYSKNGNGSRAQVIATWSGKRFRPLSAPKVSQPCGMVAFFARDELAVIVGTNSGEVSINKLYLDEPDEEETVVYLRKETIGPVQNDVGHMPHSFSGAARAAVEKAQCRECSHIHYALEPKTHPT